MSKFKVGDKVKFRDNNFRGYYIVEIVNFRIFNGGGYNSYEIKHHSSSIKYAAIMDDEIELYKTPHQRLLDMGFNFWDNSNGLQYDRKEIGVLIDKETKTYKTYWVVDDMAFSVDIELAEVLVDYLKELENE